jgi:hypothetical protein
MWEDHELMEPLGPETKRVQSLSKISWERVGPDLPPKAGCVKTQIELRKLLQRCIESFFKPTLFA